MTGRLLVFVLILMPGWFVLLRYYFFDPYIMKNIPYGLGGRSRNLLDVYLPYTRRSEGGEKTMRKPTGPVLIFLSGGAWIIGYKMWSCLLAREFARFGYIVVCPDYRNFPQGNIEDMIADATAAIAWTKAHIELFGGDPDQIILSGQSAGAHIAACTVAHLYKCSSHVVDIMTAASLDEREKLEKSLMSPTAAVCADDSTPPKAESDEEMWEEWRSVSTVQKARAPLGSDVSSLQMEEECIVPHALDFTAPDQKGTIHFLSEDLDVDFEQKSRSASDIEHPVIIDDIKMFVGISGPYNLKALEAHFHFRGLDSAIIEWICLGDVIKYSPTHALASIIGYNIPCQCLCQCMCAHPSFATGLGKRIVGDPVAASAAIPAEAVAVAAEPLSPYCHPTTKTLKGFPAVALFHGCQDMTIPASVSTELCSVLEAGGVEDIVLRLYKDYSHTDAILERVLTGDCQMLHDMASIMYSSLAKRLKQSDSVKLSTDKLFVNVATQMKSEPRVGAIRASIARFVNPF